MKENHQEKSFHERVYDVVRHIPRGKVATYGQVAALIGSPRASRFVGFALHANPYPGEVPCHRVVFKSGQLTPSFAFGGPGEQYRLLRDEGVTFLESYNENSDAIPVVDLAQCQWQE